MPFSECWSSPDNKSEVENVSDKLREMLLSPVRASPARNASKALAVMDSKRALRSVKEKLHSIAVQFEPE